MASVNKVILVGNLGKDPETRYMPNGEGVTSASLATTETWKDKEGNKQEATEWHRLVFYRKLSEIAAKYLKKGSQIYIEGKLRTRKWQDKDGIDRYTTEIIVDEMKMLGKREGGGGVPHPAGDNGSSSRPQGGAAGNSQPAGGGNFNDFDDDIPF